LKERYFNYTDYTFRAQQVIYWALK